MQENNEADTEVMPQADRYESALRQVLDAELATVPESLRRLIPAGDVVAQLEWVRAAKAEGLFSPRRAPKTDAGTQGERRGYIGSEKHIEDVVRRFGLKR